jgi:hypothetical protein
LPGAGYENRNEETLNNNGTWLANFLNKQREIIEAAETPFAKLAIFILPILAPLVPATFTGLHLYKLLLQVFDFNGDTLSRILAFIAALVLELLGYVGAVSFIQSLFRWIRNRREEYLLPATLNGIAYLFYLIFMWAINVQLGKYFQTPPIMNNIIGLLSFITVPTSLLAANHLSQKEEKEDERETAEFRQKERILKYKIKHGINPDLAYQQVVQQVMPTQHEAGDFRDYVFELLDQTQGKISLTEITATVNKNKRVRFIHANVKGTWYKYQQAWLRSHSQ